MSIEEEGNGNAPVTWLFFLLLSLFLRAGVKKQHVAVLVSFFKLKTFFTCVFVVSVSILFVLFFCCCCFFLLFCLMLFICDFCFNHFLLGALFNI